MRRHIGGFILKIIKTSDYKEMSMEAGKLVVDVMKEKERPVLGLATGSTPEGLYEYLIEQNQKGTISFKNTITFNLDEYIGLPKENPSSYYFFMMDKLFNHIDIPLENVSLPNGMAQDLEQECRSYEEKIEQSGPIDVQILGVGVNGHIAFNEPGTSFSSKTQVVDLTESTISANARFFDNPDDVPRKAISMGLETIMRAKKIILLASGEQKAEAMERLVNGEISEEFPVSILKNHPDVTVIGDEAAFKNL